MYRMRLLGFALILMAVLSASSFIKAQTYNTSQHNTIPQCIDTAVYPLNAPSEGYTIIYGTQAAGYIEGVDINAFQIRDRHARIMVYPTRPVVAVRLNFIGRRRSGASDVFLTQSIWTLTNGTTQTRGGSDLGFVNDVQNTRIMHASASTSVTDLQKCEEALDVSQIEVRVGFDDSASGSNAGNAYVHMLEVELYYLTEPIPPLQHPLTAPDYHGIGAYSTDYPSPPTQAFTKTENLTYHPGATNMVPVYNITSGIILTVEPFTGEQCRQWTGGYSDGVETNCIFEAPQVSTDGASAQYAVPSDGEMMRVVMRASDSDIGLVTYLVRNPRVEVGMVAQQSCYLGDTLLTPAVDPPLDNDSFRSVIFVGVSDDAGAVPDAATQTFNPVAFTTYPVPGDPCNEVALVRPLTQEDEHPISMFSHRDDAPAGELTAKEDFLYFAPAVASQAAVYSVAEGQVIAIETISTDTCMDLAGSIFEQCIFSAPQSYSGFPPFAAPVTYQITSPIIRVVVQMENDDVISYYVRSPRVSLGQTVSVNCLLGYTVEVVLRRPEPYTVELPIGSVAFIGIERGPGVPVEPQHDFYAVEWTTYPDRAGACNVRAEYGDCLSINPQFDNDGEFWTDTNPNRPALWMNPGVLLEPDAGITMSLQLPDPAATYGIGFSGYAVGIAGVVEVSLGQTRRNYQLTNIPRVITEAPTVHQPGIGGFFDLTIRNTSSTDVIITYLCVTEGETRVTPGECYFRNHTFNLGLEFWTHDPATSHDASVNAALIRHGGYIAQNVTLLPEQAGENYDYTLTVDFAGGIDTLRYLMDVTYPDGTAVGTLDMRATPGEYTLTLTINALTEGDMRFTVRIEDDTGQPATGSFAAVINSVCIEGPFPGQNGGEETPGGCGALALPTSQTTENLLIWHWRNLDRFFQCQLMPVLTDIYTTLARTYDGIMRQFQYWMHFMYRALSWTGDQLLPWLAGYLSNIQPGTVIVNTGDEGGAAQCEWWNILCFITTIIDDITDLIGDVLPPILDAISQVIGILERLIDDILIPIVQFIINLLTIAFNLLTGLLVQFTVILIGFIVRLFDLIFWGIAILTDIAIAAITAPPKPIPGLPMCATPDEAVICVGIWVLDNTVFASTAGALIIPTLATILWVHLGLWVVAEIRRTVLEVGSVS